ncbi:MAG TPA: kelch repeat-containing protein [Acidimicrobiales bacterium]|nr:kelch repeat-containing protein [Acidimicrobiales bacterium]
MALALVALVVASGLDSVRGAGAAADAAGAWVATSSMDVDRGGHTATLLLDGRVLVTGGVTQPEGVTRTAEVYDPATGSWSPTGSMQSVRAGHTATLLDDGNVLVTGGETVITGGGGLATAEVYDPAAGTWRATGSMSVVRVGHSATLLPGGKVLVVGGANSSSTSATAIATTELYDPAATTNNVQGQWAAGPPMRFPRSAHTATRLSTGNVLVAGGSGGADIPLLGQEGTSGSTTLEVYEPKSGDIGSWGALGSLTTSRVRGHAATLLPGGDKVLLSGGITSDTQSQANTTGSAEVYEAATGRTTQTSSMSGPRLRHTATLMADGKVLVAGGYGGDDTDSSFQLSLAEIFDPGAPGTGDAGQAVTGAWSTTGSMIKGRSDHTATLLDGGTCDVGSPPAHCGLVLATGGDGAVRPFACDVQATATPTCARPTGRTAEFFDPEPTRRPPSVTGVEPADGPTHGGTTVLIRGVGLAGATGVRFGDVAASHFEVVTSTRLKATSPPHPVGPVSVTVTTPVAVSGSSDNSRFTYRLAASSRDRTTVTGVSPAGGTSAGGTRVTVTGTGFFPAAKVEFGGTPASEVTVASDTEIVALSPPHAAGTVPLTVASPQGSASGEFTYGTGAWTPTGPLTGCQPASASCAARTGHTATLLPGGKVLVAGGTAGGGAPMASAELYDPASGTWAPTGGLANARWGHTATLLPDGKVLVVGGFSLLQTSAGQAPFPLPSTELYDADTGIWAPSDSLLTPRGFHTATLLGDAVLVAGGSDRSDRTVSSSGIGDSTSAELYDLTSRLWVPTGDLAVGRWQHSATLLRDGRVLAAGGWHDQDRGDTGFYANAEASSEIYDPMRKDPFTGLPGAWSPVPVAMHEARAGHTATLLTDGDVLVAGGDVYPKPADSAEIFRPVSATWVPAPPMPSARRGHTATLLPSGLVLATPDAVYDPAAGAWRNVGTMETPRTGHTATLIGDTACGPNCGRVLAVGGCCGEGDNTPLASSELYSPAPRVTEIAPRFGPRAGGTTVVITGTGLGTPSSITFGDVESPTVTAESATRITAVSPPHAAGSVPVVVTTGGGSSGTVSAPLFTYADASPPSAVEDLVARALSESEIELTFPAPASDGNSPPPAQRYVVKQAAAPIVDDDTFYAATSLCGGECGFLPIGVGEGLSLRVGGLAPNTAYHYAVRPLGEDGDLGPLSRSASATTISSVPNTACAALPAVTAGKIAYPAGYSLVGLPPGTMVGSRSPLYGWWDQGGGGAYQALDPSAPAVAGRGYWAWAPCPRLVELAAGADATAAPLGAYRASLVGNPSATSPATVSGHDFVARWDPGLNAGAGGYRMSGLGQPEVLAVGEGAWAFSYRPTTVIVTTP